MDISERAYWELLIKRGLGRLLVLARLLESPAHGYAIARGLKDIYPGCCEPSDAMIYPMLKQLYEGGYIACEARSTEGGRPQKLCALTPRGRDALREAVAAWKAILPEIQQTIETVERTLETDGRKVGPVASRRRG